MVKKLISHDDAAAAGSRLPATVKTDISIANINSQTASYTLAVSDTGKIIPINSAAATNITVPLNSSVAFPVGGVTHIVQVGTAPITLVPAAGVTVNGASGLTTRAQYSVISLLKLATNTWTVWGDAILTTVASPPIPTFGSYGAVIPLPMTQGTSTDVAAPPQVAVNDIVVVVLAIHEDTNTVVLPSPFVEAPSSPVTTVFGQPVHICWKRATTTEAVGTTYTFTHSNAYRQGVALRFSGCVTTGVPFEATVAGGANTTTGGVIPSISSTTLGPDRLLLYVADNYDTQLTCTPPTGFTEHIDSGAIEVATKSQPAAGSTGAVSATWATTNISTEAWLGALKPAGAAASTKKIIYFSYFNPNAQFLNTNRVYIDTLPFDGVAFHMLPPLLPQLMSTTVVSQSAISTELNKLGTGTWTKMIDKWVLAYAAPVGAANTFTNDGNWAIAAANFGKLAAEVATRTTSHHIKGIFFDTETYFGQVWQGPDADNAAAYARGNEIMDAIIAAWPTAVVMTTHSTWASDSRTYSVYNGAGAPYDDLSPVYNNCGSFFAGMVNATFGTAAQMIDGSEMYTARTASAYQAIYNWNKFGVGVAGTGCVVPSGDQAQWAAGAVDVGFGVFDQPWNGVTMDENIWKSTLQLACNRTDEHVWAYTERYDWLGVNSAPNVPSIWVQRTSEVTR